MKIKLSSPVRRLLLMLVFGVAPFALYLGFMRPQGRQEYFLRQSLRDLEVLSDQIGTLFDGPCGESRR